MRFNSKELKMALSVESFRNQFLNLPINFSFIERKETAALSILENPGPLSISSAKIANPRSANSSRYSYFNPIIVRAILFFFPAISASRAFQLFAGVGREGELSMPLKSLKTKKPIQDYSNLTQYQVVASIWKFLKILP